MFMAHVRKDCFTASPDWWDHLRPFNKRKVSKAERRGAKEQIVADIEDAVDNTPTGLGLHNDPREMAWMRSHDGALVVPTGLYCYDENGNCPYLDVADNKPKQCNGFCWLKNIGDWDEGGGEIWDQVKLCNINDNWSPDGTFPVIDEKEQGATVYEHTDDT